MSAVSLSDGRVLIQSELRGALSLLAVRYSGQQTKRVPECRDALMNAAENGSAHVETRFGAFTAAGRRLPILGVELRPGCIVPAAAGAPHPAPYVILSRRPARSNQRNFAVLSRAIYLAPVNRRPAICCLLFTAIERDDVQQQQQLHTILRSI